MGGYRVGGGEDHGVGDVQLVSDEFRAYVSEIVQNLESEEMDEEARAMLISNALEEFQGKEAQLCKDQACSRWMETLVSNFTAEQLSAFLGSLFQDDQERLTGVMIDPFASHVLEMIFDRTRTLLDMDPRMSRQLQGSMGMFCDCLQADRLRDVASHKYGSHVLRSLIVLLSGIEYPTTRSAKGWNKIFNFSIDKAQGRHAKYGADEHFLRWKGRVSENLLALPPQDLVAMAYDQYGSPALQTFLQCNIGEEYSVRMISRLLQDPRAPPAEGEKKRKKKKAKKDKKRKKTGGNERGDEGQGQGEGGGEGRGGVGGEGGEGDEGAFSQATFMALTKHNISSHLIEAIFIAATEEVRGLLYSRCIGGQITTLAMHPFSNFVVQALLTCVTNKNTAKELVADLLPSFSDFLVRKKGGVVAATLNMCQRLNVRMKKASGEVERILRERFESQGVAVSDDEPWLVTSLLEVDRTQPSPDGRLRYISKVGATILSTMLKFPQEKCNVLTSVARLRADQIAFISNDFVGVRVLESFLDSAADVDTKRAFVEATVAQIGSIAALSHASFFVVRCFAAASDDQKERIARNIGRHRDAVARASRGQDLLHRLGVDLLVRGDVGRWRDRIQRGEGAGVRGEYAQAFNGGNPRKKQRRNGR